MRIQKTDDKQAPSLRRRGKTRVYCAHKQWNTKSPPLSSLGPLHSDVVHLNEYRQEGPNSSRTIRVSQYSSASRLPAKRSPPPLLERRSPYNKSQGTSGSPFMSRSFNMPAMSHRAVRIFTLIACWSGTFSKADEPNQILSRVDQPRILLRKALPQGLSVELNTLGPYRYIQVNFRARGGDYTNDDTSLGGWAIQIPELIGNFRRVYLRVRSGSPLAARARRAETRSITRMKAIPFGLTTQWPSQGLRK